MNTPDRPDRFEENDDALGQSSSGAESAHESAETERVLPLTVAGPCKNTDGHYVGLSGGQRAALKVKVGDSVLLVSQNDDALGMYTVGPGRADLLGEPENFTANGLEVNTAVKVRRIPRECPPMKLPFEYGAENDPKHERRRGKISGRFDNHDGESYLVLPTAVARQLQFDSAGAEGKRTTKEIIGLGNVRIGRIKIRIPIVPAGGLFEITTQASVELGIPENGGSQAEYFVDKEGVLVINSIT